MFSRLLRGVGALLVLVALLVGAPLALIAWIGNPWPPGGWSEVQLLTTRTLYGALAVIGWAAWAQMTACILVEAVSAIKSIRERGLIATVNHGPDTENVKFAASGQQRFARLLITWVAALGIGAGTVASASAASPGAHVPDYQGSHAATSQTQPTREDAGQRPAVATSEPTTLWKLAETHLGAGSQWRQLLDTNRGITLADGTTLASGTQTIPSGSTIRLPAGAVAHTDPQKQAQQDDDYIVRPGDNLTEIARSHGHGDDWTPLYEANKDVIGDDPDLIYPGQVLVIPSSTGRVEDRTGPGADDRAPHDREGTPDEAPGGDNLVQQAEDPESAPGGMGGTGDGRQGERERPPVPAGPATAEHGANTSQQNPSAAVTAQADDVEDGGISALRALLATAACLSAGALGLLAFNRRRQFRTRRIGRTIAATPAELADVEQAIVEHGSEAQKDVEFLDRALRHVAASCKVARSQLPQLGAAVLGEDDLTLLFTSPAVAEAPEGWTASDDARAWILPRDTYLEEDLEAQPAPYPALVSIGQGEAGHTWHLDLETIGLCGIGGDPAQVAGLARFWVAELAVNEWAEGCEVLLAGQFGTEMVRLNPARLRHVDRSEALARAAAVTGEIDQVEENLDADVLSRRRDGLVLDSTNPVVVVVDSRPSGELADDLESRDRSRVVVVHGDEEAPAVELRSDGTAYLPLWGISVKAFSMTPEQVEPVAEVLAATRNLEDEPMPNMSSDEGPLGKYALADGSLREEYTKPRSTEGNDPSSLLPDADEVYLATAATTAEDLAVAAPSLPEDVRAEIEALDPTLTEDLADWFDETSPRPKVRLLGPVDVRVHGGGDPASLSNLAGTISFIAYLACQDRGVTAERVAEAFGWKTTRTVQNRATDARFLLGRRPDGGDWLPEAGATESARRGAPTYELVGGAGGVLVDFDLFRRLHFRARKRGDAGCEEDLVTALSLVDGAPFEASTDRRFPWLFKGQRHDDIMSSAIQKVAHVLATRAVAEGRTDLVRLACEAARKSNPYSDVAWLDLAAAAEAESGRAAADELVRENVVDRFDEDLPPRTETVLDQRDWAAG